MDFILAGYTGRIQVWNKGIKKPFKEAVRSAALQWMMESPEKTKTSLGQCCALDSTSMAADYTTNNSKHLDRDWVAYGQEGVLEECSH